MNDNKNPIDFLIEDLDYYKKTSKFIYLIENLEKTLNTQESMIKVLMKKIKEKIEIENKDKQEEINKIIANFLEISKKKYLKKVSTTDYYIYEYDEHYKWYIKNKKIDITSLYEITFKEKKIIKILIDNNKRYEMELKNLENDFKNADKIEIWIKK